MSLRLSARREEFKAIHVRHLYVQNHEVRSFAQHGVTPFDAVLCRAHLIAGIAQMDTDRVPYVGIIIHNEHVPSHRKSSLSGLLPRLALSRPLPLKREAAGEIEVVVDLGGSRFE